MARWTAVAAAVLALAAETAPSAFAADGAAAPVVPLPPAPPVVFVPAPVAPPLPTVVVAAPAVPPLTVPRLSNRPETTDSTAIPPVVSVEAPGAGSSPAPAPPTAAVLAPPAAGNGAQEPVAGTAPTPAEADPPAPEPAGGAVETPAADTGGNTAGDNSSGITPDQSQDGTVMPPSVWIWNWTWNCDPSSAPAVPAPPPGSTIWIWNWQWDCPGGAPATAAVPSVCVQCNVAVSIRIASPGNDGDVTQSNVAAALAAASSASSTAPVAPVAPVVVPLPPPPPLVLSLPPIPPPPLVDVQRMLDGVVSPAPAALAAADSTSPAEVHRSRAGSVQRKRALVPRHMLRRGQAHAPVEPHLIARDIVPPASEQTTPRRPHTKVLVRYSGGASRPLPTLPPAPLGPSSPMAAGTFGSSGHSGGASALTVAPAGALTFLAFALLSSILPITLPGRRRLSDDRHARPG